MVLAADNLRSVNVLSEHEAQQVLRPAHMDEYLGVWAVAPRFYQFARQQVLPNLAEHVARFGTIEASQAMGASSINGQYELTPDGTAVIELRGSMMKFASSFGGGGTVACRRKVRAATNDPYVKNIVLLVDTPGGTVSGTEALAADIAAAAKKKPVYAHIEDLCCSAGYWVASQATRIFAENATTMGGCIGTYAVVNDWSKAYEEAGIETHLIKAGEYKGAGVPGTKVTGEQLREWQREVNELNEQFVRGVAKGRGVAISSARDWADGRVFVASEMLEKGLIDGIQSLDQTLAMAAGGKPPKKSTAKSEEAELAPAATTEPAAGEAPPADPQSTAPQNTGAPAEGAATEATSAGADTNPLVEDTTMSTQTATDTAPKAATIKELKAACPGADEKFLLGQLEAEATIDQARSAWIVEQNSRLEASETARKEAENKALAAEEKASAQQRAPGNREPLGGSAGGRTVATEGEDEELDPGVGPSTSAWRQLVASYKAKGKTSAQAVIAAAKADPSLHKAMLAEYQEAHAQSAGRAERLR